MLLRCRRNGGDCPCGDECRADDEAGRQSVFAVTLPAEAGPPVPATVRPSWRRPEKPPGDWYLAVHHTGDGWWLHWASDTERLDVSDVEIVGEQAWPFVETYAFASDWRALGIRVV